MIGSIFLGATVSLWPTYSHIPCPKYVPLLYSSAYTSTLKMEAAGSPTY